MSIESLSPYSPTTVYGQLTSPFTPKNITINAHTPYDEVDETETEVYSRDYFEGKNQAKLVYTTDYSVSTTDESEGVALSNFSLSEMDSNDILNRYLSSGYSAEEAVTMKNAYNSYRKSALLAKDAATILSSCSYVVS